MGVRFRKSVKILPGVRINLTKSGISTTIGPRGASVNISKRGTYLNTGIPGTGLHAREKLSSQEKVKHTSSTNSNYDQEFLQKYELFKPITMRIISNGKILILDKNGEPITDESFLKKMKSMSEYKEYKEQLVAWRRDKTEQEYAEAQEALIELINIHRYSFAVKPLEEYEQSLSEIKLNSYQVKSFILAEPTMEKVETDLVSHAALHVTSKAFWRVKKLREEYVRDNLEQEYKRQHTEWEKKKQEYDQKEKEKAEKQNAAFAAEYEATCANIKEMIAGSNEYVSAHLEEWLSSSTLPVEVNVDYEYEEDTGNMYVDLQLPTEDVIPHQEMIKLANGGVKEKNKTKQTLQTEYATMIFGLGICIASGIFNISPAIKRILVSGFAKRRDNEGDEVNECLYSIKFGRNGFEGVNIQEQNPIEFFNCFENRYKATQTWTFKAVNPYDDF